MITIDGHTFDEVLPYHDGWIIDAGCRGFNFSTHFYLPRGSNPFRRIYAIDIEDFSVEAKGNCSTFKQAALTTHSGQTEAHYFGNGTGNFIKGINEQPGNEPDRPCETKTVQCITLQDIYDEIGTDIDILKLDIEGAEYAILENIEPIPKQITVEFHEHCHKELHDKYIDKVMDHLCKYYHCSLYIREWPRYKYMDCLFIRKDIA
jgi:FkbM family methyltransferase